mmetsp:Transcript_6602/g.20578  ORF Transcript_6602/g.20578 Transcript_6602/m.20578 type:complete len:275 (+) Transcript_6602:536-1360(+)
MVEQARHQPARHRQQVRVQLHLEEQHAEVQHRRRRRLDSELLAVSCARAVERRALSLLVKPRALVAERAVHRPHRLQKRVRAGPLGADGRLCAGRRLRRRRLRPPRRRAPLAEGWRRAAHAGVARRDRGAVHPRRGWQRGAAAAASARSDRRRHLLNTGAVLRAAREGATAPVEEVGDRRSRRRLPRDREASVQPETHPSVEQGDALDAGVGEAPDEPRGHDRVGHALARRRRPVAVVVPSLLRLPRRRRVPPALCVDDASAPCAHAVALERGT